MNAPEEKTRRQVETLLRLVPKAELRIRIEGSLRPARHEASFLPEAGKRTHIDEVIHVFSSFCARAALVA